MPLQISGHSFGTIKNKSAPGRNSLRFVIKPHIWQKGTLEGQCCVNLPAAQTQPILFCIMKYGIAAFDFALSMLLRRLFKYLPQPFIKAIKILRACDSALPPHLPRTIPRTCQDAQWWHGLPQVKFGKQHFGWHNWFSSCPSTTRHWLGFSIEELLSCGKPGTGSLGTQLLSLGTGGAYFAENFPVSIPG